MEVFVCNSGYYGTTYPGGCPLLCDERQCSEPSSCWSFTGLCTGGCQDGWHGQDCRLSCTTASPYCQRCDQMSGTCQQCSNSKYSSVLPCDESCVDRRCSDVSAACPMDGVCGSDCQDGWFGDDCARDCSKCQRCSQSTGVCEQCKLGIYYNLAGDCNMMCNELHCAPAADSCPDDGRCSSCADRYHGTDCKLECSGNCQTCRQNDGICQTCQTEYYFLANNCNKLCIERNCATGSTCSYFNGYCNTGCQVGWHGSECKEKCSTNCATCDQHTGACLACKTGFYYLSTSCSKMCSNRHCVSENTCPSTDGQCDGGCRDGWYGVDCMSPCFDRCTICDRETGECVTCKSGLYSLDKKLCTNDCSKRQCVSGSSCPVDGMCTCKAGYYLPDCTGVCSNRFSECAQCTEASCDECVDRYFLDINDRCAQCPGNCTSCVALSNCIQCEGDRFYGSTCQTACSRTCLDGTCFKSGNCKKCGPGFYGSECSTACTNNCKIDPTDVHACRPETGLCEHCPNGRFGDFCSHICQNCFGDNCTRVDGACHNGCKSNYYGNKCTNICSSNCQSGNTTSSCQQPTGKCYHGCVDGYYDDMCSSKCGVNCAGGGCHRYKASCLLGCADGWQGDLCDTYTHDCGIVDCSTGMVLLVAFGCVVVLSVIIVVILGTLILMKFRRINHKVMNATHHNAAYVPGTYDTPVFGGNGEDNMYSDLQHQP